MAAGYRPVLLAHRLGEITHRGVATAMVEEEGRLLVANRTVAGVAAETTRATAVVAGCVAVRQVHHGLAFTRRLRVTASCTQSLRRHRSSTQAAQAHVRHHHAGGSRR
jgi:hypothetical protein